MLKYLYTSIVMQEVPDEISLAISFANCPIKCEGCHSKELWEDKGTPLTFEELDRLVKANKGITCICFMGGEYELIYLESLFEYCCNQYDLKIAWYTGLDWSITQFKRTSLLNHLDYIKIGSYKKGLGGLDKKTTNQKFYKVWRSKYDSIYTKNITFKFQ